MIKQKTKKSILCQSLRPLIASGVIAISCVSNLSHALCEYNIDSDWGIGFSANILITNDTDSVINGWDVTWEYTGDNRNTSNWNASVTGSNPYTASNLSWNANIQPGDTVEIGIEGSKSLGIPEVPTVTGDVCEAAPIETVVDGTRNVFCGYDDETENDQESLTITSTSAWTCSDTTRDLVANGVPDHEVGTFPNENNPTAISAQDVTASYTLDPIESDTSTTLAGANEIGYVLNGVKIDAGTAGTCDDSGSDCSLIGGTGTWSIEALGQTSFNFGDDQNHAHVQPTGEYHYHGMPEGFITKQGGNSTNVTLVGWAADGFPIYARYGYSDANDASSEIKNISGSYQLISDVPDNRPSVDLYALGTFSQDWEYVEGTGDLDACNGRFGVTPEFPGGIYHYYATDSYPYFQRCVNGEVESDAGGPPPPPQ